MLTKMSEIQVVVHRCKPYQDNYKGLKIIFRSDLI